MALGGPNDLCLVVQLTTDWLWAQTRRPTRTLVDLLGRSLGLGGPGQAPILTCFDPIHNQHVKTPPTR